MEIFKKNAEMLKNKVMAKFYSNVYSKLKGNSLYYSLLCTNYEFDKN